MRLIDADALKGWIEKYRDLHTLHNNNRLFSKIRQEEADEVTQSILLAVDAQSTVDAVEVIHAKLLNPNPYGLCSHCNYLIDIRDGFNYCPNCGAKMDEVTE